MSSGEYAPHPSLGIYRPEITAYYDTVVALGHKSAVYIDRTLEDRDNYVGRGGEYCVFMLTDPTKIGKVLLGRWVADGPDRTLDPTESPDYSEVVEGHQQKIQAYEQGLGADRLEQLVGSDAAHPQALVTEYIIGNSLDRYLSAGKVFQPQEFLSLFSAYEAMHERGLEDDPDAGNIMYSQRTGFSVIDYRLHDSYGRALLDSVVGFTAGTTQLLEGIETEMQPNAIRNGLSYQIAVGRRYGQDTVRRMQESWQGLGTGHQRLLNASAKYL